MITEEEKTTIINEVMEKVVLELPDIVGRLFMYYSDKVKKNREFYTTYPEFKPHTDVVVAVCERIEGADPVKSYEDILKEAVPEIKKRISQLKGLDIENIKEPKLSYHGEI